jgi:hypothetical protein
MKGISKASSHHLGAVLLSTLLLLALTAVNSQAITIQSATRVMNFTTAYSMEYFTHNKDAKPQVRFTLRMKDYDISSWTTTQGTFGIWLGIGFGSQIMDGADIIHCQIQFSNSTTNDIFVCNDRYSSIHSLPPLDAKRDTVDITTNLVYKRLDSGKFLATFEAVFDRPCNTGDTED